MRRSNHNSVATLYYLLNYLVGTSYKGTSHFTVAQKAKCELSVFLALV
jgi:hypothetical protein